MKIKYLFILTVIKHWRRNCGYTEYKFILTSVINGKQIKGICDGCSEVLSTISQALGTSSVVYYTEETAETRKQFAHWGGFGLGHPSKEEISDFVLENWPATSECEI